MVRCGPTHDRLEPRGCDWGMVLIVGIGSLIAPGPSQSLSVLGPVERVCVKMCQNRFDPKTGIHLISFFYQPSVPSLEAHRLPFGTVTMNSWRPWSRGAGVQRCSAQPQRAKTRCGGDASLSTKANSQDLSGSTAIPKIRLPDGGGWPCCGGVRYALRIGIWDPSSFNELLRGVLASNVTLAWNLVCVCVCVCCFNNV